MATERQIAANRRNAGKSTGPKTPEGKERSRVNAITHGLCSRQVLLKEEDPETFRDVWMGVFEDLRPEGEVETYLACRVASGIWRMNRVARIEAQLFNDSPVREVEPDIPLGQMFKLISLNGSGAFDKLGRYETTIDRGIQRALKELRTVQAARGAREERIADEVSETLYRRRMEEALHNRGGEPAAAPAPAAPAGKDGVLRNEPNGAQEIAPRPPLPRGRGGRSEGPNGAGGTLPRARGGAPAGRGGVPAGHAATSAAAATAPGDRGMRNEPNPGAGTQAPPPHPAGEGVPRA